MFKRLLLTIALLNMLVVGKEIKKPITQFQYNENGLQLIAVLTNDGDFFNKWNSPIPPKITSVGQYNPKDTLLPILVFSSTVEKVHLTYDIEILKPDGSTYESFKDLLVWKDEPATVMHLTKQPLVMKIEQDDPYGRYQINMVVKDILNRINVPIQLSFDVVKYPILTGDDLDFQMSNFYKNRNDSLIIPLMIAVDNSDLLEKESFRVPTIGFFTTLFSNTQIAKEEIDQAIEDLENKDLFEFCFNLSITTDTILNWDDHSASVNDLLWAAYFASGDTRFLKRLVYEMEYCNSKESISLLLTGGSAKWSIGSNARQHESVKTYLKSLMKDLPKGLKTHLKEALKIDPEELQENMVEAIKKFQAK